MKLKQEFEKYQELFNKGFRFNPEEAQFFTSQPDTFQKPEGYEWEIIPFDRKEYLNKRLEQLVVSEQDNKIELIDRRSSNYGKRESFPIFTANIHGDIEIMQYSLKRDTFVFTKDKNNANRENYHAQVRLNPLYADICEGKYDFTEAKNTPFWHKYLIEAFEEKKDVPTLVITEGQFKAWKATQEGIPTVGITSITHYKQKETSEIHSEILEFIKVCNVKKVVILWDADCRDISLKQLEKGADISARPKLFYRLADNIKSQIIKWNPGKKLQVFFATIREMEGDLQPKGIDDLLCLKQFTEATVNDFSTIGEMPGRYIYSENITQESGVKKMRKFFKLDFVGEFYQFHKAKIKEKNFIFDNNTYKVESGAPKIEVAADLKVYKLIGTQYYKLIQSPVPTGKKGETVTEEVLEPWTSDIIKLVHGKNATSLVERYEGFTNIASHTNYKAVIDNHWNLYYNIDHKKEDGDFPTIRKLLSHLFEEHYDNEMILDYITVLYRYPMQKLPVICLVSREQGTGKSTFLYLLKLIFKQNMTIISNQDLTGDFNSQWTSKLIVASEETLLEKKDGYEKIKSLSTAKTIMRNEKNKTAKEIPCMVHFVFCSNHENDFIKIDDYDSRLWIRKVKQLQEQINDFDQKLEDEIPQLINFIEAREIKYEENGRLFFNPRDFRTEAFHNLVAHSKPSVIKDMEEILIDSFMTFGGAKREMTAEDFRTHFGIRGEINYLNKVIKAFFNVERKKNKDGQEYVTTYNFPITNGSDLNEPITISKKGRPFEFFAKNILTAAQLEQVEKVNTKNINLPF